MVLEYNGPERREFIRLDFVSPLAYKVCSQETISKLLKGYVMNISETGLLCNIRCQVNRDDILWLSFDRATLSICAELDNRCFIYQSGIVGKVVRVEPKPDGSCNVGIHFIDRVEEDKSNILPPSYFGDRAIDSEEDSEEETEEETENGTDENEEET